MSDWGGRRSCHRVPTRPGKSCYYYRSQLGQGNVFTAVCDSVHRWGCLPQCMLGSPPPPPGGDTGIIRSTSGRYASYWNAFLFTRWPNLLDMGTSHKCTISQWLKSQEVTVIKPLINPGCYLIVIYPFYTIGTTGFPTRPGKSFLKNDVHHGHGVKSGEGEQLDLLLPLLWLNYWKARLWIGL